VKTGLNQITIKENASLPLARNHLHLIYLVHDFFVRRKSRSYSNLHDSHAGTIPFTLPFSASLYLDLIVFFYKNLLA
jgi:hypothetical protein